MESKVLTPEEARTLRNAARDQRNVIYGLRRDVMFLKKNPESVEQVVQNNQGQENLGLPEGVDFDELEPGVHPPPLFQSFDPPEVKLEGAVPTHEIIDIDMQGLPVINKIGAEDDDDVQVISTDEAYKRLREGTLRITERVRNNIELKASLMKTRSWGDIYKKMGMADPDEASVEGDESDIATGFTVEREQNRGEGTLGGQGPGQAKPRGRDQPRGQGGKKPDRSKSPARGQVAKLMEKNKDLSQSLAKSERLRKEIEKVLKDTVEMNREINENAQLAMPKTAEELPYAEDMQTWLKALYLKDREFKVSRYGIRAAMPSEFQADYDNDIRTFGTDKLTFNVILKSKMHEALTTDNTLRYRKYMEGLQRMSMIDTEDGRLYCMFLWNGRPRILFREVDTSGVAWDSPLMEYAILKTNLFVLTSGSWSRSVLNFQDVINHWVVRKTKGDLLDILAIEIVKDLLIYWVRGGRWRSNEGGSEEWITGGTFTSSFSIAIFHAIVQNFMGPLARPGFVNVGTYQPSHWEVQQVERKLGNSVEQILRDTVRKLSDGKHKSPWEKPEQYEEFFNLFSELRKWKAGDEGGERNKSLEIFAYLHDQLLDKNLSTLLPEVVYKTVQTRLISSLLLSLTSGSNLKVFEAAVIDIGVAYGIYYAYLTGSSPSFDLMEWLKSMATGRTLMGATASAVVVAGGAWTAENVWSEVQWFIQFLREPLYYNTEKVMRLTMAHSLYRVMTYLALSAGTTSGWWNTFRVNAIQTVMYIVVVTDMFVQSTGITGEIEGAFNTGLARPELYMVFLMVTYIADVINLVWSGATRWMSSGIRVRQLVIGAMATSAIADTEAAFIWKTTMDPGTTLITMMAARWVRYNYGPDTITLATPSMAFYDEAGMPVGLLAFGNMTFNVNKLEAPPSRALVPVSEKGKAQPGATISSITYMGVWERFWTFAYDNLFVPAVMNLPVDFQKRLVSNGTLEVISVNREKAKEWRQYELVDTNGFIRVPFNATAEPDYRKNLTVAQVMEYFSPEQRSKYDINMRDPVYNESAIQEYNDWQRREELGEAGLALGYDMFSLLVPYLLRLLLVDRNGEVNSPKVEEWWLRKFGSQEGDYSRKTITLEEKWVFALMRKPVVNDILNLPVFFGWRELPPVALKGVVRGFLTDAFKEVFQKTVVKSNIDYEVWQKEGLEFLIAYLEGKNEELVSGNLESIAVEAKARYMSKEYNEHMTAAYKTFGKIKKLSEGDWTEAKKNMHIEYVREFLWHILNCMVEVNLSKLPTPGMENVRSDTLYKQLHLLFMRVHNKAGLNTMVVKLRDPDIYDFQEYTQTFNMTPRFYVGRSIWVPWMLIGAVIIQSVWQFYEDLGKEWAKRTIVLVADVVRRSNSQSTKFILWWQLTQDPQLASVLMSMGLTGSLTTAQFWANILGIGASLMTSAAGVASFAKFIRDFYFNSSNTKPSKKG